MIAVALLLGAGLLFYSQRAETPEVLKVSDVNKFDAIFKKYGAVYGVEWRWLKTWAQKESSLGRHKSVARGLVAPWDVQGSVSEDGKSWGIMQLLPSTAQDFDKTATPQKLNDPDFSVKIAAQFIASLKRQFGSSVRDVVMAYNQGAGNQKRFLELEKLGTLKDSQYPAARVYLKQWLEIYRALFGANP